MSIKLDRDMSVNELALQIDRATKEKLRKLMQHCTNCDHFDLANEICTLCDVRPPAIVIVEGCPKWVELIPF